MPRRGKRSEKNDKKWAKVGCGKCCGFWVRVRAFDFSRAASMRRILPLCRRHASQRSGVQEENSSFLLGQRPLVSASACGTEEWRPRQIFGTTEVDALTRTVLLYLSKPD